jgi:septum formation protein
VSAGLVLASASPRRARILESLGVPFRVVVSAVDETLHPGEDGAAAVERLARGKAEAVARTETAPVLGADTEVVCDGRILGKPGSPEAALEMLAGLAGRTHEVLTGVCLVHAGVTRSAVERTVVALAPLTEAERRWYVATGEPLDKAGGYHVDGRGALFVASVTGSPSNVAGLPVRLVLRLLREAGLGLDALPPAGGPAPSASRIDA